MSLVFGALSRRQGALRPGKNAVEFDPGQGDGGQVLLGQRGLHPFLGGGQLGDALHIGTHGR